MNPVSRVLGYVASALAAADPAPTPRKPRGPSPAEYAKAKRAARIAKRKRLALTWPRRPVQHPLVTLAERAPPMSVANLLRDQPRFYRTPTEARRWARNRRKHARGKAAQS